MQVSTFTPTTVCPTIEQAQNTIDFYETAIADDETIAVNYWHLGVAYLFAGREDDAQAAWFTPLATTTTSEVDNLTVELLAVLEGAAMERAELADLAGAWLLRQHIWMLAPELVDNILHAICLANLMGTLTTASLVDWQVSELLQETAVGSIEEDLLEGVLGALLAIQTDLSLEIIESCLQIAGSGQELLISKLMDTLLQISKQQDNRLFIIKVAELCNTLQPDTLDTLPILSYLYSDCDRYPEAKAAAERYYRLAPGIVERVFGSYQIQRAHFKAGNWQGVTARVDLHRQLLAAVIDASPQNLDRGQCQTLLASSFFLPYTEDNPRSYKSLQNQLAAIYQQNIQLNSAQANFVESSSLAKQAACLRIGYIGSTFRKHSVGWLSRWLIHHHDRQSFQVFLYCINLNPEDPFNHQWFRDKVDITSYFNNSAADVVAQIRADKIDILIDLDSLTHDLTYLVMAQKPAPIQISWLGWDSIGIPAVDYFIADSYVLPDDAQDYYADVRI
jgi:predicted O-linked N-acetylglucosamine transferase (SPINDLY family)